ncbi:hypothetical protein [Streptomyces sp. NRRL F-2580]|uniref:hypothetical protein n=1 Tax=Streptomyces sp. NRRL F-2580 TaxID=1463841 RepID=UPI00131C3737|nr:hypothetical protein [Streptomyces sp. NRRL F-2580]
MPGAAGPARSERDGLALAYGLASVPDEDRDAAVRALAQLGASGRLDGAMLGRDLAELVQLGTMKVPLLTESLRAAAALPRTAPPSGRSWPPRSPASWPPPAPRRTAHSSPSPRMRPGMRAQPVNFPRSPHSPNGRTRPNCSDRTAGCATSSPHSRHTLTPRT